MLGRAFVMHSHKKHMTYYAQRMLLASIPMKGDTYLNPTIGGKPKGQWIPAAINLHTTHG
jgi:hypothetical protein